jgi:hypothetical protein
MSEIIYKATESGDLQQLIRIPDSGDYVNAKDNVIRCH